MFSVWDNSFEKDSRSLLDIRHLVRIVIEDDDELFLLGIFFLVMMLDIEDHVFLHQRMDDISKRHMSRRPQDEVFLIIPTIGYIFDICLSHMRNKK